MKYLKKIFGLCLTLAMTLSLCACKASGSTVEEPAPVAEQFVAQSTLKCTASYDATVDVAYEGESITQMELRYEADGQLDLTSEDYALLGNQTITIQGEDTTYGIDVYNVGAEDVLYSRMGDSYYTNEDNKGDLIPLILMPADIDLSDYEKEEETEDLYGNTCDIYSASMKKEDLNIDLGAGLTNMGFSLEGSTLDMVLYVYQDTSLPARLTASYTNLADQEISFSDESGYTYTLTALNYEIVYEAYGEDVDVALPDSFKEALSDQ